MDKIQLTWRFPEMSFPHFDRPEQFLREMRLAAAVKWYETQQISQSKAAEIAGISRAECLVALNRFGVTPFQVTADELVQDVGND